MKGVSMKNIYEIKGLTTAELMLIDLLVSDKIAEGDNPKVIKKLEHILFLISGSKEGLPF